jgi:hypothetical protein
VLTNLRKVKQIQSLRSINHRMESINSLSRFGSERRFRRLSGA